MKEEVRYMRTLADEVNNQITAGRTTIKKSLPDMGEIDMRRVAPAGYVIAGVMVAAVVVGVGWMVYRSRRRRTLVQRLQAARPEGVQRHAEGVGRLAVQPRVADREHVDLLGSHLDGDRDGSVVGDAAVHELAAADRDRRKDAWNRAAREQRGHGRS